MESLRTRIPHLIQMLMDKGVEVTFGSRDHGPVISWSHESYNGHVHLDPGYIRGSYGANAIQIERELVMIFVDLPVKQLKPKGAP
jgi:hypothetical protein